VSKSKAFKNVFLFKALYILLAFVPFAFFNQELLDQVREQVAVDVVSVAIVGALFLTIVAALFFAEEGVNRYNQFLFAPSDLLSILVGACFLFAAVSWWLVPEVAQRYELGFELNMLLFLIIICQLPMVLFLSLMTVVGKA